MRVTVMCIGNELLLDEGVGPAVGRYLASRYELPACVEILDRAVMGMAIISDLRSCDFMLVLDAVDVPGAAAGQVFSFAPDDVATTPAGALSLHDVRFADVLGAAELLGIHAQGHCLGVQVENMAPSDFVVGLTPKVAAAVSLLAAAAARYLRDDLGLEVRDRVAATDPFRAGSGVVGARDFSTKGLCVQGREPTIAELGEVPRLELPQVHGEPDSTVMAGYLSAGLTAVGAGGAWEPSGASSCGTQRVVVRLPGEGEASRELVARFGLEACEGIPGEYAAFVRPNITDYDCDALIGAALALVRA